MTLQDGFKLECAFASGPLDPAPTWTDITAYWKLDAASSIVRGRGSEQDQVQTGTFGLTLDNTDGRFTVGNTSSPYYPNVKLRKQIRATYREQLVTRTNLAINPRAVGVAGWNTNNGANWTSALNQSLPSANPLGTSLGCKVTPAAGVIGISPNCASLFNVDGMGNTVTSRFGGVWVLAPVACTTTVYLNGNQAGTTKTTSCPAGVWTFCPSSAAGTGYLIATVNRVSGNTAAGDITYLTDSVSDSTSVPPFGYNGAAADYQGYHFAWTGTADASTTTATPIVYPIFKGYVDEWPVEWPDGGELYALAQVRASDRFKPLGSPRTLRSVPAEEILLAAPSSYYPLADAQGATTTYDATGATTTGQPLTIGQVGVGGSFTFGTGTGVPTDGASAPQFVSTNDGAGNPIGPYLTGAIPSVGGSGTASLVVAFNATGRNCANPQMIALTIGGVSNALYTSPTLQISLDGSTGKLRGSIADAINAQIDIFSTATALDDGHTHVAALTATASGGSVTLTLYLDGVQVATGTATQVLSTFNTLNVGLGFTGTLCHAAAFGSALTSGTAARLSTALKTGFVGESTGARIARVADWCGIATGDRVIDTGNTPSVRHVDTTGKTAVGYMQELADTEGGLVFIDTQGRLRFQQRGTRINEATALTLDASSQQVSPDVKFRANDQLLINDVTYFREGGITFRATDTASIGDNGNVSPSGGTVETLTTSDNEVRDHATWVVYTSKTLIARIEGLGVDMLTDSASRVAALQLDLSSKVAVTNMPGAAPGSSSSVFLEGYTETISVDEWSRVLNTSPADLFSPLWQLGVAGFSELGSTTVLNF